MFIIALCVVAILVASGAGLIAYGRRSENQAFELSLIKYAYLPLTAARKTELAQAGRTVYEWVRTSDITTSLSVDTIRRYHAMVEAAAGGGNHVPASHRHRVA